MSRGPGRESLAARVQRRLEALYDLPALPNVEDFLGAAAPGEREQVLVRESGDDVELAVILPSEAEPRSFDGLCQVVEGVSHFVYLVERVRTGRPTTQLELELQAEVDKFALLGLRAVERGDVRAARRLHAKLYENARFLHGHETEAGERYRLANDLAARFCAKLPVGRARATLRRFFGEGQTEKIRLARAA